MHDSLTTKAVSNIRRSGVPLISAAVAIGVASARLLALPPDPGSEVTGTVSRYSAFRTQAPAMRFPQRSFRTTNGAHADIKTQ
jgi:hypothetical protein